MSLVFEYFDLYFVLIITIKADIETIQKIVNNLINENIFPLKDKMCDICGESI